MGAGQGWFWSFISSVVWWFCWKNILNWIDNVAKGTLKRKDHFSLQNKVFSQETLKKNSQAPNASRPDSRPLPKQKHSLDASFLQWQNSSKDLFYGSCSVRT